MSRTEPRTAAALDAATVRARVGEVTGRTDLKKLRRLDRYTRRFIELSPFLCLGTTSVDGSVDVSPRGDPPGFVRVLDDRTVAVPERPGNRIADSLINVAEHGGVALLFMIPGFEETVRVNGRGRVSDDPALLAEMAVDGRVPKLVIVVEVDEVYFHCAKAFRRSRLWSADSHVERSAMPTLGAMLHEQAGFAESGEALDAEIDENYRTELY